MADHSRSVLLITQLRDNMTPGMRNIASGGMAVAGAIAGISTVALIAAKKLSDMGAEIYDTASRFNVSLDTMQGLSYVARQTGSDLGGLAGSVRALNTLWQQAENANSAQRKTLEDLGLSYVALRNMQPEQAYLEITDAIGRVTDATDQNLASSILFGQRYGSLVVAAVNQADGSMRNMMDTFRESGRMMSEDQLVAMKKYSDAMTDLDVLYEKLLADALVPMLPVLQEGQESFAKMAEDTLPKLIPLVEAAIDIMMNSLPTVIQALGLVADGWEKISNTIQHGSLGTGEAQQLVDALTQAVEVGAITAEQATAEWEKYTNTYRSFGEQTLRNVIMPLDGVVAAVDNATATYGIFRDQQILVSKSLDETARSAFAAADAARASGAGAAAGGGGWDYLVQRAEAAVNVFATIRGMILSAAQGQGEEEEEVPGLGSAAARKAVTEAVKQDLKAILEEAARIEDERAQKELQRINASYERTMSTMAEEAALAAAEEQARVQAEQARIQLIAQGTASLFTGIAMAATQGEDALKNWFDTFKARLLELTISSAFQALLGVLLPGGFLGGIFGGIFGRAGGGIVFRAAHGGTVPGSLGYQTDMVPALLKPGEVVGTRQAAKNPENQQGGNGVTLYFTYSPTFSTASRAEVSRFSKDLVDMLRRAGVNIA